MLSQHNMMEHAWLVDTPEWEKKKKNHIVIIFIFLFSENEM